MIKTAILTISTASSLTYGATGAFDAINKAAQNIVHVYSAAGDIMSVDGTISATAEARMYAAAAGLQPVVDQFRSGTLVASN